MGPVNASPRERAFMALMLSSARQVTDARAHAAFAAFRADEAARATMKETTGGRDMAGEKEPESTRQRLSMADESTSFTYAAPETAKDDSPFSLGSMASGSSTEERILDRAAKARRCREELVSLFGHKPETIGEAIRKNSEALDRASDEALSLAAERSAMRDAANGLCGPFMVPANERSHAPGSPPTAECGCHLPSINGHDPRYCKERERIIGTQPVAAARPAMYRCSDPLCDFMTSDKDAIEQHVENQRAHASLAEGLQQQIGAGGGQRTFTRAEVLTVLRAEKTRQSVNGIHHAAIWALDTLIKIFDRME